MLAKEKFDVNFYAVLLTRMAFSILKMYYPYTLKRSKSADSVKKFKHFHSSAATLPVPSSDAHLCISLYVKSIGYILHV
jgi:hypothetical protein